MSTKPLSMAEFKAMSVVAKDRSENLSNMFAGTELSFSKYAKMKAAKDIVSDGQKLGKATVKFSKALKDGGVTPSAVSQAHGVVSQTHELISIASGMDFSAVQEILTSDVTHSLVGELTPFVGVITSTVKAAASWRAVVKNAADLYKSDYYLEGVLPGDPTAAAEAVITCIKRFLAANSADAARNTASAAVKIGGLFADFGTGTTAAAGAASVAAKLIQDLAILGRDYKDMKAGNKRLLTPGTLDFTVFKECPVLGCHLIANSDTSKIVNFMIADIGLPGWMDKVERMKKTQLDPLISNANKAITSSHLTLDGLKSNKGTIKTAGFMDRQFANAKYHFNQLISSNAKNAMNT